MASDNIKAANTAADVLVELIAGSGQVACIPFIPGAATSTWRETGFREGLEKYPEAELVAVQYSQADVATAMAVTENILTAWPDLDGIFRGQRVRVLSERPRHLSPATCKGKVKLVAFDAAPNEIEALKSGVIQALIVQQPFEMGYTGSQNGGGRDKWGISTEADRHRDQGGHPGEYGPAGYPQDPESLGELTCGMRSGIRAFSERKILHICPNYVFLSNYRTM